MKNIFFSVLLSFAFKNLNHNMRRSTANLFILAIGLCTSISLFAQENLPAENIVITSSVETYRYEINKSTGLVEVKGEIVNKYNCNNFRETGYFVEFFDDQTTLDAVDLIENGVKAFAPKILKDYSIDGIFYSDAKMYNLELGFAKKDSKTELKLKKTIKDPRYFCTVYFHESYPVSQKEIVFVVPRWMNIELKEFNFDGYTVAQTKTTSEKEDADIYSYVLTNLKPRKAESRQPGSSYIYPHLMVLNKSAKVNDTQVNFFNTLDDQYKWYRKLTSTNKTDVAVIKAKAQQIVIDTKTDLEKAKAVLYWVHDNIRYIAFEDGIAGFKPDEAQNVLNNKYGDCKGMANLIKELLVSLGLDARLAWIGTNHIKYDYSTPALCVDNHMIACLILNGKKYFLDGTESYLPLNIYAERIQGRQVLVENGDKYFLEKIPVTNFDQNLSQFKENLKIADNALTGDIEFLYRGESKQQLMSNIHNSKKEKLDAQLERYITNNNKNYLVSDIKTADLNQVEGDLWIKFKANNANAVSAFGNDIYIDIDYNKSFNHFVIDSTRQNDYCFSYKYNYKTETQLEIPAGYKVSSLPTNLDFNHADFNFSINFTVEKNVVRYTKKIHIKNTFLKKSSFSEWNKAVEQLSASYSDQLIFTKI